MSGSKMLARIAKHEAKLEKQSLKMVPTIGRKASQCYESLGQLLFHAECIGCCVYNCVGGGESDHAVPYLVAKVSSFGRAALRLTMMGFYDEALIIVRSIGEITNLFSLFNLDPKSIEEWKKSDRAYRRTHFSPSKVRHRIESLGGTPMISSSKYASLCEVGTHAVPTARLQRYNHPGRSITGGVVVQPPGILVVLNEMALALPFLVILAAKICKVPTATYEEIRKVAIDCLKSGGAFNWTPSMKS
jgi:hypothetical protein